MISLESKNLWKAIGILARQSDTRHAAVAYVSDDAVLRFRDNDTLITDASDDAIMCGRTSATVIKRAIDAGAEVYHAPHLHAKVLLFDNTVVVGSQNLSVSSRSSLDEAGMITDVPAIRRAARQLLDKLRGAATRIDRSECERLLQLPTTRPSTIERADKQSLLEALKSDSEHLRDFVFCLWHDEVTFTRKEILEHARAKGFELPTRNRWEKFEDYYANSARERRTFVAAYERNFERKDRKTLTFQVEHDEAEKRISSFVDLGTDMLIYINHFPYKRHIIGNFKKDRNPPFRLEGTDARRLLSLLNRGLRSAPEIARSLWRRPGWFVEPLEIRQLLHRGEDS